eukprot:259187_1
MAETELAMHISDHDERVAYDPTSAIGKSMTMIEHEKTTPFKEHMRTVADAIALSCADIAIIGALVFSSGIGTISAHLQLQFSEDDVMDILTQCFLTSMKPKQHFWFKKPSKEDVISYYIHSAGKRLTYR